jgi:guanylate kinase
VARQGLLIVISAPSGAGKHALLSKLRARGIALQTTVSATTRAPRKDEIDGRDYHFLTREAFEQRRAADAFVEWAEVHGNLYGTLRAEVARCLEAGGDVLLELDVQGMRNLRALGMDFVGIFILPPSFEELERRLRGRGSESERDLQVRLANAKTEMTAQEEYDYRIVNDDLDRAADELADILATERRRADVNA